MSSGATEEPPPAGGAMAPPHPKQPPAPPKSTEEIAKSESIRRWLMLYDVALLLGLVALAILYFRGGWVANVLPVELKGLPAYTAWFGMLGSIAISMKGIHDHGPEGDWGGRWPLWYFGRPFMGLLVG